jgi:multicomponent Na+:H+ antiporter subunit G
MIDGLRDMVVWVCLLGGGAFSLIGGIGLIRMPDFYTRSHAASLTDTMGAFLILLGLMLHSGANLVTVKLLFIFAFIVLTSPTAAHALVKAAYSHGLEAPHVEGAEGAAHAIRNETIAAERLSEERS